MFITEVMRVCRIAHIEVPLENIFFVKRALKLSPLYGHIIFDNAHTLPAIMKNMGLEIQNLRLFSHSKEYKKLMSIKLKGWFYYMVKTTILKLFPRFAVSLFTCMVSVLVYRKLS